MADGSCMMVDLAHDRKGYKTVKPPDGQEAFTNQL